MKLWSSMEKSLYDSTLDKGITYTCCTEKCEMLSFEEPGSSIHKAYDWLSSEITKKVGKPPEGVRYPVWAWHTLNGIHGFPDLNGVEFRGANESMVMIDCDINDEEVLLSDEEWWTAGPLNNAPCFSKNDSADEELYWYYDNVNVGTCEKEKWKLNTWYRIFDIKKSRYMQATFWMLKPENVVSVTHYN